MNAILETKSPTYYVVTATDDPNGGILRRIFTTFDEALDFADDFPEHIDAVVTSTRFPNPEPLYHRTAKQH